MQKGATTNGQTHSRKEEFRKVGENLYGYSSNDRYYGVFRVYGKLIWKFLKTSDRDFARRKLKKEKEEQGNVEPSAGMAFSTGLARGGPARCARVRPQAAHFSTVSLLRTSSARRNARRLRPEPGKKTLVARPSRPSATANDRDAKAIPHEPRSANSMQFPLSVIDFFFVLFYQFVTAFEKSFCLKQDVFQARRECSF